MQPVQRRTRSNGQRTRQRLLESAVSLWSQHGMLGVTVSAIAEHAGTTRRTVYHHFPSQDQLLSETQRFVEEELIALAGGNAGHLADPYGLVARLAADNPDLIRSVLLGLMRDNPDENAIFHNAVRYWTDAEDRPPLRGGIPPEHAAAITLGMWLSALLVISTHSQKAERHKEADRFARTFETLLHQGFLRESPEA